MSYRNFFKNLEGASLEEQCKRVRAVFALLGTNASMEFMSDPNFSRWLRTNLDEIGEWSRQQIEKEQEEEEYGGKTEVSKQVHP